MKIYTALALFSVLTACSAKSSSAHDSTQVQAASIADNSCIVKRSSPSPLSDGTQEKTVHLVRQVVNGVDSLVGEQLIYGEGTFPNDYVIVKDLPASLTRQILLSGAIAWKWSLGSKQNENSQWTILTLYKEVLFRSDGRSYVIDTSDFAYGEANLITDKETGISVGCLLPKS